MSPTLVLGCQSEMRKSASQLSRLARGVRPEGRERRDGDGDGDGDGRVDRKGEVGGSRPSNDRELRKTRES